MDLLEEYDKMKKKDWRDVMSLGHVQLNQNRITPLTRKEIDELFLHFKHDIDYFPMMNKSERFPISKKVKLEINEISRNVDDASHQIEEIFQGIRKTDNVPINEIKKDIVPVISQATEIPHVYHLFEELQKKDEYTYRHNICVGVIAGLIGKWLGYKEEALREIELAGLLHDIGKTKISNEILHKPTKLTKQEYKEIKKHPLYGYDLLRKTPNLAESIVMTALQHHEREDGLGYPFRLKGSQIHPIAKIVAVADVFHAMSSDRIYREATPFYKVITKMNDDVFGMFDPKVMIIFLRQMMETLIGKRIQLSDGRVGTIIMNHPYNPLRSLVQLENKEFIDLRKEPHLQIEKVFKL